MDVSEFITGNMEKILDEWVAFASTLGPAADTMDVEALRDHAKEMLTAIAADLNRSQSPAQQEAKGKGHAPTTRATRRSAAGIHGTMRAEHGFTLTQMISEYRALRASVLRLYNRAAPIADPDVDTDVDDLMRFHEAVDQAIAESVVTYSKELDRSRDILVGIIGHDLRNPLGVILRSAGTLLDIEEPSGPGFRAASHILDASRRMRVIVGDLLDLTRIRLGTGGGLPINPSEIDLARIARQMTDETAVVHPGREVRFEASGNLRGRWDAGRVGQALSNLIGNAIQHGAADSLITVTARGDADEVVLSVHNIGPTIPQDSQSDIFLPMKQLAGAAPADAGIANLGLGLYIAKEIAAAHGGSLDVESTDAAGTTFSLHLPRRAGSA